MSSLKEKAAGAVGEQTLSKKKKKPSHGKEGEAKHTCHKHSPQKGRNDGAPGGHSGQIALRREQM
jgi:hypothetical protein